MSKDLAEAIIQARTKAAEHRKKADEWSRCGFDASGIRQSECLRCAEEQEQFAAWFEELQSYREADSTKKHRGRANNAIKPDTTPSCNSCLHNGEWSSIGNCIKCRGFDRYERRN